MQKKFKPDGAPAYKDYNPEEYPWHLYIIAFVLFLILACMIVGA